MFINFEFNLHYLRFVNIARIASGLQNGHVGYSKEFQNISVTGQILVYE